MGACGSTGEVDDATQRRNNDINKELRREKAALSKTIQILLLGAGESGKSTFLKQMRILFTEGIPKQETFVYRDIIYANIIVSIATLTKAAKSLGFTLLEQNHERANKLSNLLARGQYGAKIVFDEELAQEVASLWADPALQSAFQQSHRFQLSDSTAYFMEKLKEIASPDYLPSLDDILHSRSKTSGICEISFDVQDAHFKMVDVGGQRSERSKWIYCFEDVTAIIYFASLSEYNLALQEDASVNRMTESLKIFHQIANAKWFVKTPIILFLNKSDIFKEKITQPQHSLSHIFPDYKGGDDFDQGVELIRGKFLSLAPDPAKVYPHVTCCTDTSQTKFVFSSVRDSLLKTLLTSLDCPY